MWLELQDSSGIRHALPDGAKLTLLSGNRYYLYTLTGGEKDGKNSSGQFCRDVGE
ncbi:MAG: hypothetical protein ACLTBV_12830 [Enterocloster bolteae]